ncbi:hypothetical protein RN001_002488 [Aquatica leii]|uniref:Uncharacterized protein n=1 Tax=Aquatica leii TaxID=1421715 RepID=A0AAN7SK65_9COLE|nr:hypothetical protein RN001_002488 [Aquatica leii]
MDAEADKQDVTEMVSTHPNIETLFAEFHIPEGLKKLLTYSGFDNIYSVSVMKENDKDFKQLETFARKDLSNILEPNEFTEIYGIYTKNINLHKIPSGHKMQLTALIEKCYLMLRRKSTKNQTKRKVCGCVCTCVAETNREISIPKRRRGDESNVLSTLDTRTHTDQKEKIVSHIKKTVLSYIKKVIGQSGDQEDISEHSIPVSVDDSLSYESAFAEENMSCNAYVYMAQPLVDKSSAFCLTVFGSDNKFSCEHVLKRWKYIEEEARKIGIVVEGFSSDADPRCLKAMKFCAFKQNAIGDDTVNAETEEEEYCPYGRSFKLRYDLHKPTYIQDTVHIGTKLKTRFLKYGIVLPIGQKYVSPKHIEVLIDKYPKDQHFLCKSDLQGKDKMNFDAVLKLSANRVTNLLENLPESQATRQFLLIIRYILDAFLDKEIDVLKRVYLIWYTIFFLRLWKQWLACNNFSVTKNFITQSTYACIELNGHGLLLQLEKCKELHESHMFLPWLYSSRPCEKIFRQTRSMTTTYSTIVNYSLTDILRRLNRIKVINDITNDLGDSFCFPRKVNNRLGSGANIVHEIPSTSTIICTLENAKQAARQDATALGMILNEQLYESSFEALTTKLSVATKYDENNSSDVSVADAGEITFGEQEVSDNELYEDSLSHYEDDSSIFANLEDLNIKDYCQKSTDVKTDNQTPYITIKLKNGKTKTIRKSSLCWFFSEKKKGLSSDRILRVRGMNTRYLTKSGITHRIKSQAKLKKNADSKSMKNKNSKIYRKSKNRSLDTDISNDTDSDNTTQSYEINDTSDDDMNIISTSLEDEPDDPTSQYIHKIYPTKEAYYAIFYDAKWYIGRVLALSENQSCTIKFLQEDLDTFVWSKNDDIQEVENKYIYHGPIQLLGNNPFSIKRTDRLIIIKQFKQFRRLHV